MWAETVVANATMAAPGAGAGGGDVRYCFCGVQCVVRQSTNARTRGLSYYACGRMRGRAACSLQPGRRFLGWVGDPLPDGAPTGEYQAYEETVETESSYVIDPESELSEEVGRQMLQQYAEIRLASHENKP